MPVVPRFGNLRQVLSFRYWALISLLLAVGCGGVTRNSTEGSAHRNHFGQPDRDCSRWIIHLVCVGYKCNEGYGYRIGRQHLYSAGNRRDANSKSGRIDNLHCHGFGQQRIGNGNGSYCRVGIRGNSDSDNHCGTVIHCGRKFVDPYGHGNKRHTSHNQRFRRKHI